MNETKYNKLSIEEKHVIIDKGTEKPWTGKYVDHKKRGTYVCKRCDAPLYLSEDKFDSHCGWPSFDDEIDGAVSGVPDADGMRTEIICANCRAHLGHIFQGEGFTEKNTRHCVNSISMVFIPFGEETEKQQDTAIFAGGCFWGVEFYLQQAKGVMSVESGYIGGFVDNPTYEQVCSENTGHAEAVRVVFNPSETTYEELAKLFFEIHDPTQEERQGPDVGEQYRTEIFYLKDEQKAVAIKLIRILEEKGYAVATKLQKATTFWPAEAYHQDYYFRKGGRPYCHGYTRRF
ncbi:MAG: bifunctional methionine sulfoxide reductase B/A protein [Bacteroidota bacterium]